MGYIFVQTVLISEFKDKRFCTNRQGRYTWDFKQLPGHVKACLQSTFSDGAANGIEQ